MNRDKSKWHKHAIFTDIICKLGKSLSKDSLWGKYLMLIETVGPGCELSEKACMLMIQNNEELKNIIKELDEYYGQFKKTID